MTNQWELYRVHYTDIPIPPSYKRLTPLSGGPIPVTVQTAEWAYGDILENVGANERLTCSGSFVDAVDAVDRRIFADVRNGTGPGNIPPGADPNDYRHLEDPATVGGYPVIANGTPCADADHDGMPDVWETARGLNPNLDDSAGYLLDSRYTNIEVYLNSTVEPDSR